MPRLALEFRELYIDQQVEIGKLRVIFKRASCRVPEYPCSTEVPRSRADAGPADTMFRTRAFLFPKSDFELNQPNVTTLPASYRINIRK